MRAKCGRGNKGMLPRQTKTADKMPYAHPESLVSTEWLARHLDAPDIRIVDATWFLPAQRKDARAEYEARHIPGAVFFDIDEIADTASDLPHMLPAPEKFAIRVRKLGLGDGNRIVVYDQHGLMSAARVWWMFRVFGHKDVAVLDGGLPKWLAEGRPVEDRAPQPRERHFTARYDNLMVRDLAQMRSNLVGKREQVVDARAAGRFNGTEPEVWPGRRSGHIPGSRNVPYAELLDPATKTLLPGEAIAERFRKAGVDLSKPIVTSCGSGVTAAVLAFALHLIGHQDVALYDGSWAEWGRPGDTPVEP
jgi:thiosulfate/3-mercaptopyruvate sulfurtransferase